MLSMDSCGYLKMKGKMMLKLATIALAAAFLLGGAAFALESTPAVDPADDAQIACCWGGGWGGGARGGMGWGGGRGGYRGGGCYYGR